MIKHQTFSPSTCDCVIEQSVDYDEVTGLGKTVDLLFFHNVCDKHEPIVKNKKQPADLDKKRQDIIDYKQVLLAKNRERHMKDFDDSKIKVKNIVSEMKKSANKKIKDQADKVELQLIDERYQQEILLDRHEEKALNTALLGLHSPYALISQEVYTAIHQEQVQANG